MLKHRLIMGLDVESRKKIQAAVKPDGDIFWIDRAVFMIADAVKDIQSPVIVDAGCGTANWILHRAEIKRGTKIGIDIDQDATENKHVDKVIISSLDQIPLPDNYADLIISSFVLEHLENPELAFNEFSRILKPGGRIIFWTTNRYNYAMILSSITSTRIHNMLRKLSFSNQKKDNCKTYYRANTPRRLQRLIKNAGMAIRGNIIFGSNAYSYWGFSRILFTLALYGSKLIGMTRLRCLKCAMLIEAEKPTD